MKHYSVLKNELIDSLNIKSDGVYVDATLGYAGDSLEVLRKLKRGFLFAFDQDEEAIKYSDKLLKELGQNYELIHTNFVNLATELVKRNITEVDGIIFDLGLSSPQIDEASRGFSFMQESVLDMRMDQNAKLDAKVVVNHYDLAHLMDIFYQYGEEKYAKSIAKKIIEERKIKEITTTTELTDIIKKSVPTKYFNTSHPERRIFQAIRIEVNNELKVLESILPDAIKMLKPGGRLSVITFHSLEDRIVKQIFNKYSKVDALVSGLKEIPDEYKPLIKLVNKKPIIPSETELKENSRSKSAKLRVVERI